MHAHLETLHQLYTSETQSFRKVHRMIDLFESIIKSHTVVVLGEYVKHNKLSDAAKGMLAQGLRTPSLGTWQLFSRVMFEELQADGYAWTFTDFAAEFAALDKALNADKTNVIAFRNGYAHGATPTDAQCLADIAKFDPFLKKMLDCRWLTTTHLETRDGKVWVIGEGAEVCVHPVLVHKADGGDTPFAFFNDLKNDKVGLLNYPLSKHYREKDFFAEFHEFLPLHEWKKSGNNEFYQRIEELTETFKGRTLEREKLLQFVCENHKGYCSIQGNPGIGKSALIAQFFKDLRAQNELTDVQVVEYFIRRGTQQADIDYLLNYLIKRTDEFFPQGREIRAEGKMTFDLQNQLFSKWRQWAEHSKGKKLLFLIDGLDEGVEKNVLAYMPRENFENILIIYGSRPGGHKSIDDLWATLPTEHHTPLLLEGLSKADIRALIYEVANKYEVERESAWIDAVQQRSQGNPLYLRLLCNAIENGSIALNDVNALPKEIDEYYNAILSRYAQDLLDGDALLAGLFAFAAARDYLTMAHLGLINKLGDATVQRIGSTLKEVLYENPLTEEVLDYQLFHESFREYLVKEKAMKVNDAVERIIDFCSTWRDLEGTWEQRYALQHYAAHAAASAREARATELLTLPVNTAYIETQKKVLKQFDATKELYRLCLLKASELKQYDQQLEAALCLVDLKYEEANDAPQVVALVAAGDIDLALKRIESFGGTDNEGVERRFTLYMLCLLELTLLESKIKPFRKMAIERLLNHLDEQIPTDTSIMKWNDFFPSYLMFLMACEWAELGLDYLIVYKRTDDWERDWISEKGLYNDLQFEVLLQSARVISTSAGRSSAFKCISSELAKTGKKEAAAVLEAAVATAREINDELEKLCAFKDISIEFGQQGELELANTLMQEALNGMEKISSDYPKTKNEALSQISIAMIKLQKSEDALTYARDIGDIQKQISAFKAISAELARKNNLEEAYLVLQEALACARSSDYLDKSLSLKDISSELAVQGKLDVAYFVLREALECARGLSDDFLKSPRLPPISTEFFTQNKKEEASEVMQEAFDNARGMGNAWLQGAALLNITEELFKQDKIEAALECVRGVSAGFWRDCGLTSVARQLVKKGLIEKSISVIYETLAQEKGLTDESKYSQPLKHIAIEMAKRDEFEVAIQCARSIIDASEKSESLIAVSNALFKKEEFEKSDDLAHEALENVKDISPFMFKVPCQKEISKELFKFGRIQKGTFVLQQALECLREVSLEFDFLRNMYLVDISQMMAQNGMIEAAIECALDINELSAKNNALKSICDALAKEGKIEKALECARGIGDESYLNSALHSISSGLANQGKTEEALESARGISSDYWRSRALTDISGQLYKYGKLNESSILIVEILDCIRGIKDEDWRSSAFRAFASELFKQGKINESETLLLEVLGYARAIKTDKDRSNALAEISMILFEQDNWELAENVALEIPLLSERHSRWKKFGESSSKDEGWQKALHRVLQFQTDEARLFYLNGWAEAVNEYDADATCVQEALGSLAKDSESIETLMQKHALHEVFFGKAGRDRINRLNRTLNIQWALDIVAKFPKEESSARLSTNLDTWLHEIADEDDRDQVELWAKQVAKGKITEEDFGERVNGL